MTSKLRTERFLFQKRLSGCCKMKTRPNPGPTSQQNRKMGQWESRGPLTEPGGSQKQLGGPERELGGPKRELRRHWEALGRKGLYPCRGMGRTDGPLPKIIEHLWWYIGYVIQNSKRLSEQTKESITETTYKYLPNRT